MGSSSKKSTGAKSNEGKDISNAAIRPMIEVPAAMPGQLDALSQQLAMGYGQQPVDLLSLMNQYYQPMQLPNYSADAGPVAPSDKSSGGTGTANAHGFTPTVQSNYETLQQLSRQMRNGGA